VILSRIAAAFAIISPVNTLYYGDNLDVLRRYVKDETVDLVYLDPPFKSNQDYNVLFAEKDGSGAASQFKAFEDTWEWNQASAAMYEEIVEGGGRVSDVMQAFRRFLGTNDMLAYLTMMAPRLVELRRVLKVTGSIYLHCDPTASHYLKVLMDGIFRTESFRNEIVWKRTTTHSDSKTWSRVSDTIFFYTKERAFTWNTPREPHSEEYIADKYCNDDGDGRKYQLDNMTSPNPRPNMMYEWKGFPYPAKGWRYSKETMAKLDAEGRIWYPTTKDGKLDSSKRPRLKRYLDEMEGGVMGNIWTDIWPINSQAQERLGYPTQKPLALLERIIGTSSSEGDTILDPFCGCRTAVAVAQRLNRQWIGIDITHLAIGLIKSRLRDAFGD
jgi:site-specific DNA-methyltransferase (adenine-specific)